MAICSPSGYHAIQPKEFVDRSHSGRRDFLGKSVAVPADASFGTFSFDEADIPLFIVTTDVLTGHEVVLSQGSVVDALMASTAIPGIFPSVTINGLDLVDGGVANNTPISTAVRLGARRIVVLLTGYACALRNRPRGAVSLAMNALNHLVARQLVVDIARYCGEAEIVIAPSLCPLDVSSYDYSQCRYLIERAAEQTQAWIKDGGYLLHETPQVMHAHCTRNPTLPASNALLVAFRIVGPCYCVSRGTRPNCVACSKIEGKREYFRFGKTLHVGDRHVHTSGANPLGGSLASRVT